MIDINVVKCEGCNGGIHVAGGVFYTEESALATYGRLKNIWIAARENEFTHVFSIDIDTMEFIRYKMHKGPSQYTNLDINLCCQCLSPIIRPYKDFDFISFYIVPQKYKSNIGIFQAFAYIHHSNICHLWKYDAFTLRHPPLTGFLNILFNPDKEEVISVSAKDEESGRLCTFSKESADAYQRITFPDNGDIDMVWHEIAFCKEYHLTRRNEGDISFLRLYIVAFESRIQLSTLDYCTVDINFPSLVSTHFFISWRTVDEEYVTKKAETTKIFSEYTQCHHIPSIIVFQTADGKNIVTIPFRILSLSEAAYFTLARISHWPLQRRSLTVAKVSIYHRFFQRIHRNLCGRSKRNVSKKELSKEKVIQCDPWMTQDFIKDAIGWPRILPLTKAPNLPKK